MEANVKRIYSNTLIQRVGEERTTFGESEFLQEEKKELPLEQVALKSSYRRRNAECITVALSSKRVGEERNTFGESCLSFEDTLTLTQGVGEERLPFGEL